MDRARFSTIAHTYMTIMGPLSPQTLDDLTDAIAPEDGWRVLDLGCGKGDLLLRLAHKANIDGLGVELGLSHVEAAKAKAQQLGLSERAHFVQGDIATLAFEDGAFDLTICMGAGSAFGNYTKTLEALKALTRPGGIILAETGFWRQPPHADYLEILGCDADLYGSHADNVATGLGLGLNLLYARTSSQAEWDHFEGLYLMGVERWLDAHPEEPDARQMRARIRRWRDAYYAWGRDTLGYGLYLFQKPSA